MDPSASPQRKKQLRSRSRSRSKEHQSKKASKNESKAKFEDEKKRGSSPDDEELEQKFKDFEAEIHAIDPSNKSEKNETKKQKTFETPENLILLYNKRIYVEGFPVDALRNKDQAAKTKEEFKDLFKDAIELAIMTPSKKEGNPLLLIDFERRESLENALKIFQKYDRDGVTLKIIEGLSVEEEKYSKQVIEILPPKKAPELLESKSKENTNVDNNNGYSNSNEENNGMNSKENSKENKNDTQATKEEVDTFKHQENDENPAHGQDPTSNQNQALQYYTQTDAIDGNLMTLQQQNGYPFMSYDQQYLYSLKQQQQQQPVGTINDVNYLNQSFVPQYQYPTEGYYQQQQSMPDPQSFVNATAFKATNFSPTPNPAEYGFNLNALNIQMTENPNALQMMPKILPEANVFIKNLNPITTQKDVENAFRVYGNILSCKIATDYYGQSLSYGYVQFELKESADACIQQANNAVFQDMIISVQPFNSKLNKIDGRNNLYIKNLPTYLNDEQLNQRIMEIFSKFGPISSSVVKVDRSLNRPFAFVCYENHIYADMAFKALHDTDPFRSGNRLYISWAEKKIDRVKRLTELHASQQNLQQNNFGMMGMGIGGGTYFQNSHNNNNNNYKNYQGRDNNS